MIISSPFVGHLFPTNCIQIPKTIWMIVLSYQFYSPWCPTQIVKRYATWVHSTRICSLKNFCLGTIFILRKRILRLFRTTHPLRKDIFHYIKYVTGLFCYFVTASPSSHMVCDQATDCRTGLERNFFELKIFSYVSPFLLKNTGVAYPFPPISDMFKEKICYSTWWTVNAILWFSKIELSFICRYRIWYESFKSNGRHPKLTLRDICF